MTAGLQLFLLKVVVLVVTGITPGSNDGGSGGGGKNYAGLLQLVKALMVDFMVLLTEALAAAVQVVSV